MLVTLHATATTLTEALSLVPGSRVRARLSAAELPVIVVTTAEGARGELIASNRQVRELLSHRWWFRRAANQNWPLTHRWLRTKWSGAPLELFTAELEIPPQMVAWEPDQSVR